MYQIMKDCWSKNPKQRPKFKTLSVNVSKLNTTVTRSSKNREAWSASKPKVRKNSLYLDISDKDVEDYDVSLHTSSYDYEVFRPVHREA